VRGQALCMQFTGACVARCHVAKRSLLLFLRSRCTLHTVFHLSVFLILPVVPNIAHGTLSAHTLTHATIN
jgi:hypothetical protein